MDSGDDPTPRRPDAEGDVEPVRRRRSRRAEPRPSLQPELLSGRSLAPANPPRRFAALREHQRLVGGIAAVLLVVAAVLAGKALAESSADRAMQQRADELAEVLADATPEDFLAFNAGVQTDGSLAQRIRDTDGFVSVQANADVSFIRFQPSGWWAGFTERCLVAYVRADAVRVETPKTACIRVTAPER